MPHRRTRNHADNSEPWATRRPVRAVPSDSARRRLSEVHRNGNRRLVSSRVERSSITGLNPRSHESDFEPPHRSPSVLTVHAKDRVEQLRNSHSALAIRAKDRGASINGLRVDKAAAAFATRFAATSVHRQLLDK